MGARPTQLANRFPGGARLSAEIIQRRRWIAAGVLLLALLLLVRACGDDDEQPQTLRAFEYVEAAADDYQRRAVQGVSHVIYARSPGGVQATAERVERYRARIETAARVARLDPDVVEAIVFLESAGRQDVIAGEDPENASGLTQILAGTATELLGMTVDLERSRRLTRQLARAEAAGDGERAAHLRARRRRIDQRFQPDLALAATGRYLNMALERFGRLDLAVASYHMGMGNLETVIRAFTGDSEKTAHALAAEQDLSYARLYFDSTPRRHAAALGALQRLQDESSLYWFKVLACMEIMRLHRAGSDRLATLERLHGAKASAEEVLHPPQEAASFDDPQQLQAAWDAGSIVALRGGPDGAYRVDRRMGELARRVDAEPELYRGLNPAALATLEQIAGEVRAIVPDAAPLIVTSAVRDQRYQQALASRNREATRNFSLHTTGYSFDIARRYSDREHALAFQFVLDRLQVLNEIAWVREPQAIHVTAAG